MGRAGGCVLRVDGGPRHLLPHRPLLPQAGDKEVQQAARQDRYQQGAIIYINNINLQSVIKHFPPWPFNKLSAQLQPHQSD